MAERVVGRGGTILALAALALWAGGCSGSNPAYCDQNTPCQDRSRPYCHLNQHRCSEVPVGPPCETEADCTNADAPVCFRGACVGCASGHDCPASAPVCDDASLTCQACTAEGETLQCQLFDGAPFCLAGGCSECRSAADCPAYRPVCDADLLACRPCAAGADCESGVCQMATGTCVDAAAVLYVAVDGSDSADCARDAPCATLERAIARATSERDWIHVAPGFYPRAITIDRDVNIAGEPINGEPAQIASDAMDQPVIAVTGGAQVTLESLVIRDAFGGSDVAYGVRCEQSSGLAMFQVQSKGNDGDGVHGFGCEMSISGAEISNNGDDGLVVEGGHAFVTDSDLSGNGNDGALVFSGDARIDLSGSTLNNNQASGAVVGAGGVGFLDTSELSGNGQDGVVVINADLKMNRCTVAGNQGGGLSATDTALQVFNNFILANGTIPADGPPTGEGGVHIHLTTGEWNYGRIEHNTVVGNAAAETLGAGGIACDGAGSLALKNNLLSLNHFNLVSPETQVAGGCTHTFTLAYPRAPAGQGNLQDRPVFVSPDDHHLRATSPGIDAATPSDVMTDVDGDARPQGPAPDMGADEVP